MAPQIIVQGGSQACRAWVRNVAAMALAADPNRTHQSVRVLGDEVAHIRYTGQGRCTIRIDGGEESKGVAFQLLHDQQLQPEWYGVSYEGSGFRVRRIAPPQFDRTWYGPGTRKLHWRAGKPPSAAQLEAWAKVRGSSAAGALVAIDEEILAAGAAAGSGTANLLILKGALGAQLQVIARWYSTGSASYQDAPVLAVPVYNGMGEVKRQVMCSSFSPDGLKVVVAGMRAGAVDVTFRAGAAPVLAQMRDADVLPAEFVSFTGGYAREAHTRSDLGEPVYAGVRTAGAGYWVGDACVEEVVTEPALYEAYAVSKKSTTQRIEVDTLDLHRSNDAADALKVAEQVQQLAMTTTTTLATTGSDPYASAVLTVARSTVRGAGTLDDARPTVMFPLAARLLAGARLIDHVAGEMLTRDGLAGALSSSSGFNTPAVRDFSVTAALDLDLRLPGWDDALVASLGGRGVVSAPIENAVVKRQVWAFGTLVATVTIQDSAPALASRKHLIMSRAFSETELPLIDANGAAARIADYGLQHIGAMGAHGGLRDFSVGYTGSFYGAVSTNVFGYGGADFGLGTYRAQRTPGSTLPWYSQFSWAFSPGSTALDGEALSYPEAYGYGTSTDPAFVAPYPGRVCDVAYSQDTSIVVTTARGTAYVAHRTAAGAVVHADLLALLGKAGAAGYSRSWWVVNLVEL